MLKSSNSFVLLPSFSVASDKIPSISWDKVHRHTVFSISCDNMIVCVCVCACTQLCLTFCDPMDCSPPGSFVHGIFLARILECVAISYPRGSSQPRDRTCVSCISSNYWPHLIVQFENVVLFPSLVICPCPRFFIAEGSMPVPDTVCSMGSYAPHRSPN